MKFFSEVGGFPVFLPPLLSKGMNPSTHGTPWFWIVHKMKQATRSAIWLAEKRLVGANIRVEIEFAGNRRNALMTNEFYSRLVVIIELFFSNVVKTFTR